MKTSFFKKYAKQGIAAFFALSIVFAVSYAPQSPTTPKANAQFATFDPLTELATGLSHLWDSLLKPTLDQVVMIAAKSAIQSLTKSITTWIRGGFEGSPAFVTDLKQHMLQVGDSVAGGFINDVLGTDFFCSPFKLDLAASLDVRYFRATGKSGYFADNTCTLSSITHNVANAGRGAINSVDDFYSGFVDNGDFTLGGWVAWYEVTVKPQNNIYGAYFSASPHLNASLVNEKGQQLNLLDWNKGFLSWCPKAIQNDNKSETASLQNNSVICKDPKTCKSLPIQTPGAVVESQLESTFGSGVRQLELANSFNDILATAATELVNEAVTGAGGLLGVSSGPSYTRPTTFVTGGYGTSAADQAAAKLNQESDISRSTKSLVRVITEKNTQLDDYNQNWATILTNARDINKLTQGAVSCGADDNNHRHAPAYARAYIDGFIQIFDTQPFLNYADHPDAGVKNPMQKGIDAQRNYVKPALAKAIKLQSAATNADKSKSILGPIQQNIKNGNQNAGIDTGSVNDAIKYLAFPSSTGSDRNDALGLLEDAAGWTHGPLPVIPAGPVASLPGNYHAADIDALLQIHASTTLAISTQTGILGKYFDSFSNDATVMPTDSDMANASKESGPSAGGSNSTFGQRVATYQTRFNGSDIDHRCSPTWDNDLRPYIGKIISSPPADLLAADPWKNVPATSELVNPTGAFQMDAASYALMITHALYDYGGDSLDDAWSVDSQRLSFGVDAWLQGISGKSEVARWLDTNFGDIKGNIDDVDTLSALATNSTKTVNMPAFLQDGSAKGAVDISQMICSPLDFNCQKTGQKPGYALPEHRFVRMWLIWQYLKKNGPQCTLTAYPANILSGESTTLGFTSSRTSGTILEQIATVTAADGTVSSTTTNISSAGNGGSVTLTTVGNYTFRLTAKSLDNKTSAVCTSNVSVTPAP